MFDLLNEEQVNLVNKNRTEIDFRAGEMIYKQGTTATTIITLNSGLAKIYIEGLNKRNLILELLKPMQFVGGPGLFIDNKHHFSISALEDSSACFIEADAFKKLVHENHDFAVGVLNFFSQQAIYYFTRMISLTQKQMPGRIADALLYLKNEVYNSNPFELNISRQEIGELSAMSTESASRMLNDLQNEGVIKVKGKTIQIINETMLKDISLKG